MGVTFPFNIPATSSNRLRGRRTLGVRSTPSPVSKASSPGSRIGAAGSPVDCVAVTRGAVALEPAAAEGLCQRTNQIAAMTRLVVTNAVHIHDLEGWPDRVVRLWGPNSACCSNRGAIPGNAVPSTIHPRRSSASGPRSPPLRYRDRCRAQPDRAPSAAMSNNKRRPTLSALHCFFDSCFLL